MGDVFRFFLRGIMELLICAFILLVPIVVIVIVLAEPTMLPRAPD